MRVRGDCGGASDPRELNVESCGSIHGTRSGLSIGHSVLLLTAEDLPASLDRVIG